MKWPNADELIIIYLGLISFGAALTDPSWWRWVFAGLALWFLGWATVRLQKRWEIK